MSQTNPFPPNTYPWSLWEKIHGGGAGVALSLSGQSLGNAAIISDGTAILIGGTNVTLSQQSNSISIIAGGGGGGGQAFTAGISSNGNTSGTTGLATGQLLLIGGNNITLSQSIDAFSGSATITISGPNTVAQSIQTQNLIDLSLSGNTAGALALISSGTAILAGGNNVTLSQNGQSITISAFNQSVQPVGTDTAGISNLGNTSGTSGVISGSAIQLILAGGNNVTLSQSVNGSSATITISAASQSVQPEGTITAGISNLGNTSGTSGVISGTGIQLILAGGNNVTLSQSVNGSSATVTISGPNTVAQTNQSLGLFASSQTTGQSSSTTVDARSISIVGQGIISVGMSAGSLLLSATTNQSVQPEGTITAGISNLGNTSGTSGVISGTGIQLILAGGNNVTLSQSVNGSSATVTISAFNQTVQTQNLVDVSLSGNTSGVLALISSGTLILAGGNNITLSQNGQSVTISAAQAAGAGTFTAGISNIGNTVGNSGTVSVQFILAGGNNITLSGSTNGQSETVTISAANQTVQTQNLIDLSLSGNTAGVLALISSGTAILAGGNNITLSQNGQSVTISGANTVAQTVQTIGLYASSQTVGQSSSSTFDARSISIVGQGIVSVGESAGSFLISATTPSQTNQTLGLFASSQTTAQSSSSTVDARSITIVGAGVASVGLSAGSFIISVPSGGGGGLSAGLSNIGNTSGNSGTVSNQLILAGGNNITLSGSTAAGGMTITVSAFTQTVQTQNLIDLSLSGNTAGVLALVSSGTAILAGGNNITLSQNGQSVTISGPNTVAQSNQTLGIYASSQTVGQSSSSTYDGRSLSLVGQGIISAGWSNSSFIISATTPAQTAESNTFGMSNIGNTSGTTGVVSANQIRFVLAGGNNITLSQSLNGASGTITISAFNQTQESNTLGISNLGNTSGTSGVISGNQLQLVLAGGNNITLSQSINGSSATITISAPNLAGGAGLNAGLSNIGNTSGNTGLVNATLVFAGGNNVTLSGSTNGQSETITISAFNQTQESQTFGISNLGNTAGNSGVVSGPQLQMILAGGNNITLSQSTNGSSATITVSGAASVQVPVISHWVNLPAGGDANTGNMTGIGTSNATLALFPLHDIGDIFPGNMTCSTMLFNMSGSDTSNSAAHTYTLSIGIFTLQDASNIALAFSGSSSWTMSANTNNSSSYNGHRWLSVHSSLFNTTPSFSNTSYWMGMWLRSSGQTYSISNIGVRFALTNNRSGFFASASASNKTLMNYPFYGIFSVSFTTGMPGTINRTDMSHGTADFIPHVVFNNYAGIYG